MKTVYYNILAILLLAGCASHVHQVARENESPFIGGELAHEDGKDNRLVLKTQNSHYEARGFIVDRQTHVTELRKRYGFYSKHWHRIFSGLDTDHVSYSIKVIASSAEGHEVSCRLMWVSRAKPSGVCTDQAGMELPVLFE